MKPRIIQDKQTAMQRGKYTFHEFNNPVKFRTQEEIQSNVTQLGKKNGSFCLSQSTMSAAETCVERQNDSQVSYDFRHRQFKCLPNMEYPDTQQQISGERFVSSQPVSNHHNQTDKLSAYRFHPYRESASCRTVCQVATEQAFHSRRVNSTSQRSSMNMSQTTLDHDSTQVSESSQATVQREGHARQNLRIEPFKKPSPPCWTVGRLSQSMVSNECVSVRARATQAICNGLNTVLKIMKMIFFDRSNRADNEKFQELIDSHIDKMASLQQNIDNHHKSINEGIHALISNRSVNKTENDPTKCLPTDYLHQQEFLLENTRIVTEDTLERLTKYQDSVIKHRQKVMRKIQGIEYAVYVNSSDEDSSSGVTTVVGSTEIEPM